MDTSLQSSIQAVVRHIVEHFQPEQIVLFGSYAYGTATRDSDVDMLVVMDTQNEREQAMQIRLQVPCLMPMDILVRRPAALEERLKLGDIFLKEIMERGTILYKKTASSVYV
jgi:predicted nucleotidyltransferase